MDLNNNHLQFVNETPTEEIDQPPNSSETNHNGDFLEAQKLKASEMANARREKRFFSAFGLIIICLAFLGLIYIIDIIVSFKLKQEPSSITDSIIEIIKTLLFTLSGYLFARKENDD